MQGLTILAVLAAYFQACQASQAVLVTRTGGGEDVAKMEEGQHFVPGEKSIKAKMSADSSWEVDFYCKDTGKNLTPTADGKYIGCCLPNQKLVGSEGTQFMCCGQGHAMAGNKDIGFSCCPQGQVFDGQKCHSPTYCEGGKVLVGGECQCPKGYEEKPDGSCDFSQCTSDVSYGKCYQFKFFNGKLLGPDEGGTYYAHDPDISHGQSVFTFCSTDKCDGKGPVGPNDTFYIKDIRGVPKSGSNPGFFLRNNQNGDHVNRIDQKAYYGEFSIAKHPECGKYCLGGNKWGLYYACPTDTPAITFWTNDPGSCIPITLLEVPCDYHDKKNNCNWHGGCDNNGNRLVGALPAKEL